MMALSKEQKKHLSQVRKLISSHQWSDVYQGLVLLKALADPQLWALLATGVSFTKTWKGQELTVDTGEIKTRVKSEHRYGVALWAARETGMLRSLAVLELQRDQSIVQPEQLRPLAGLKKLKKLKFHINQSSADLSPLASLPRLEELEISLGWKGQVADVTPLASVPKLKVLKLSLHDPKQLDGLCGAEALETLLLSCPEISDLSALKGVPNLKVFTLSHSKITNLDALQHLPKLEVLELGHNSALRDIRGLSGLQNLRVLNLLHTRQLQDLSPLASLKSLQLLKLPQSVVFKGLSGMPSGEKIICQHWNGRDLSGLGSLEAVKHLNLSSSEQLTSTAALAGMSALESLSLGRCKQLTDISGLSALPALRSIDFSGCKALVDVSTLANAPCLEELDLSSTSVVDAQPLTTIKTLKKLHLGQSIGTGKAPFIDVTPLQGCTQLAELNLSGSKVSDKKAIDLSAHLPETLIIYGGVYSTKRIEPQKKTRQKNTLESELPEWTIDKHGCWLRRVLPVASLNEAASRLVDIASVLSEETPSPELTIKKGELRIRFAVAKPAEMTDAIFETAHAIEALLRPSESPSAAG